MRGYCGIGVENLKIKVNLGTLWRSAYCLGANFIFTIGKRYKKQSSDTHCTFRHIPLFQFENKEEFWRSLPYDCFVIGVEISDKAENIYKFIHPQRAIYCLGPEDGNLSFMEKCHKVIYIPSKFCLNVASAGTIVLYDRKLKEANGN